MKSHFLGPVLFRGQFTELPFHIKTGSKFDQEDPEHGYALKRIKNLKVSTNENEKLLFRTVSESPFHISTNETGTHSKFDPPVFPIVLHCMTYVRPPLLRDEDSHLHQTQANSLNTE